VGVKRDLVLDFVGQRVISEVCPFAAQVSGAYDWTAKHTLKDRRARAFSGGLSGRPIFAASSPKSKKLDFSFVGSNAEFSFIDRYPFRNLANPIPNKMR
jgi:hypothetical protein